MPYKRAIELPFLDPQFVPDHPANHIPSDIRSTEQKKWLVDLTPAQRKRREKEWLKEAMDEWNPPHVPRAWEVSPEVAERYFQTLALTLPPRPQHQFEDLLLENPRDSSISRRISEESYNPANDPDQQDFRRFMNQHYHLGYHRFHASHGDPNLPSEEISANDEFPPEDICWIMEYTEVECAIIRRQLARRIGLFPAVIDKRTEVFNEDIAERYGLNGKGEYGTRLYVRCRRRNKRCLRPEHLIIFASNFQDLP